MSQPISQIELIGKDEPELLAMIASVSQELVSIRPYQTDHQMTAQSLDALRKVLFDVRTKRWMQKSGIGMSR